MPTPHVVEALAEVSTPTRLRQLVDRLVESCTVPPKHRWRFDDWKRGRRHEYNLSFEMLFACLAVGGNPDFAIAICEEFIARMKERREIPASLPAAQRLLLDADLVGDRARQEAAIGGATTAELRALDDALTLECGAIQKAQARVRVELRLRERGSLRLV